MFSILYELGYFLSFLLFLPKVIFEMVTTRKYRISFFKRFCFFVEPIEKKGPTIWIHAVSVGETVAISSLAKALKDEIPGVTFIVSSITETGHEMAKKHIPFADRHIFLPFDFSFSVKKCLSAYKPDLIILSETDFWWRFLNEAKKLGSTIVLVNGKISTRSVKRFCFAPFFARRLFSSIDLFCMQNELYRERFEQIGIEAKKLIVTGNLKADIAYTPLSQDERSALLEKLHIKPSDFVIVLGSTHDPEEALFLREFSSLLQQNKQIKLIFAPRHPERFAQVASLLEKSPFSFSILSQGVKPENQIILIDTVGLLTQLYQISSCAIVAGSFTNKVGGHNILEPMAFGVPTLCGPFMQTQAEFLELAMSFHAVVQLSEKELQKAVSLLIEKPAQRRELSDNSHKLCDHMRGAKTKTLAAMRSLDIPFFPSLK